MRNGSHSRHTTRFDKLPTVIVEHPILEKRLTDKFGYKGSRGTSKQRQVERRLQKLKQRQFDKKQSRPDTETYFDPLAAICGFPSW